MQIKCNERLIKSSGNCSGALVLSFLKIAQIKADKEKETKKSES
jgi:hypothetical protein